MYRFVATLEAHIHPVTYDNSLSPLMSALPDELESYLMTSIRYAVSDACASKFGPMSSEQTLLSQLRRVLLRLLL